MLKKKVKLIQKHILKTLSFSYKSINNYNNLRTSIKIFHGYKIK